MFSFESIFEVTNTPGQIFEIYIVQCDMAMVAHFF